MPEPRPEAYEPRPEEPDILFKPEARLAPEAPAVEAPAGENEPEPETAERRPYCPACHKIFSPEVLFCENCGMPLFQMVNRLPTESIPAPQQTAGQLSNEMVSEQPSSDPITIELPAKGTVSIACQPVGTTPEIIRPEPKVIPTMAAAGTKTKDRPLPLGLRILLLALLFLIFIVGIGMIVLFLISQGIL
jgi:hypothetical protein